MKRLFYFDLFKPNIERKFMEITSTNFQTHSDQTQPTAESTIDGYVSETQESSHLCGNATVYCACHSVKCSQSEWALNTSKYLTIKFSYFSSQLVKHFFQSLTLQKYFVCQSLFKRSFNWKLSVEAFARFVETFQRLRRSSELDPGRAERAAERKK